MPERVHSNLGMNHAKFFFHRTKHFSSQYPGCIIVGINSTALPHLPVLLPAYPLPDPLCNPVTPTALPGNFYICQYQAAPSLTKMYHPEE